MLRALRDFVGIDLVQFYDSPSWQGIILPTVMALIALAIPYIDEWWDKFWGRPTSRLGKNRKLGITMGLGFTAVLLVLTYLGTPYYGVTAPPAVEIGQEFIPEECVLPPIPLLPDNCGEVRRLGYDGLPVGTYDLSQYTTAPANADPFQAMLVNMQAAIKHQAELAKQSDKQGLQDAQGFFVVEDWQTNLKKVTLRITWTPREKGDTGSFEKIIYLHKDSAYE
jgi:hypothetical protein